MEVMEAKLITLNCLYLFTSSKTIHFTHKVAYDLVIYNICYNLISKFTFLTQEKIKLKLY